MECMWLMSEYVPDLILFFFLTVLFPPNFLHLFLLIILDM